MQFGAILAVWFQFDLALWAYGLRNPWRYSFDHRNRLIVGDVGQNTKEEVSIILKGANLGWNIKEADLCFRPPQNCSSTGILDPIFSYGREEGISITGGYQYLGKKIQKLQKMYIFGDFGSGRIWALPLKEQDQYTLQSKEVYSLGQFPINISTFGRDHNGEIYVADFSKGDIYLLAGK